MRGNVTKTNVSTTKSTKDGVAAKFARNWELNSNADTNTLRKWADLRAAYQKTAAVAATATVAQPATKDCVGAQRMKHGLRYGERKLTKIMLLILN